jgi:hypothetical protein
MNNFISRLSPLALALILIGCSELPRKAEEKKEPEKPPEPVTARSAFQHIFATARTWALDAEILQMSNIHLAGVKDEPGKFGAWQVAFVSFSRNRVKLFTYAVVEGPGNLHKGVFGTPDEEYVPRGQGRPFLAAALRTDSDQALNIAMEKAADYVKKNPGKPVNFLLELTPEAPGPAWRVIWGESVGTSNFSIYIDAATGQYVRTMH